MKIALDFDGTYTEATKVWDWFIRAMQNEGHEVFIVTFRSPDMEHPAFSYLREFLGVRVVFTSRVAKRDYCLSRGINIDIWIDDQPELIVNGSDWSDEEVKAWRLATNNGQTGLDGQSG